jgi:hypothetical protein
LVLLAALVVSLLYNLRFAELIFSLEEEIEKSLQLLDRCYSRVGQILEIPVGSDDPLVRSVIDEIKRAQEAVLLVANRLSTGWKEPKEQDDDTEQQ